TAASAAARKPPIPVRTTASRTSRTRGPASSTSALAAPGEERQQQLSLQVEHLPLLLRLGVVVAQQVQDAVGGQKQQLLLGRVTGVAGLPLGHARAEHDVTEQAGLGV